jgi:hypothetical protein
VVAERATDPSLRSLAYVAHRADPWLRIADAARALYVSVEVLYRCLRGIPHRRRVAGTGTAKVVIRARDLPTIAEVLPTIERSSGPCGYCGRARGGRCRRHRVVHEGRLAA